jgi:hypothetical protein
MAEAVAGNREAIVDTRPARYALRRPVEINQQSYN